MGKKKTPLCSTGYKYMFNACRVPGETEDRVRLYPPAGNHHVLVLRRNRFFVVHVTDAEGVPLSRRDIQYQLQAVIDFAGPRETETRPVGVLTAWGRPEWARARDQILADGNTELLERAEAAALAVCLDDSAPLTKSEVARALWHGDGRNRHFDKSVQIVVFSNGKAGLVGEHSMMDGAPTIRLADFVMKKTMDPSHDADGFPMAEASSPVLSVTSPRPLDFALSPRSLRAIVTAEAAFDQLVNEHEMEVFEFHHFGADKIKTFNISPDAFVQMALQLGVLPRQMIHRACAESAKLKRVLGDLRARAGAQVSPRANCLRASSVDCREGLGARHGDGERPEADSPSLGAAQKGGGVSRRVLSQRCRGQGCGSTSARALQGVKKWRIIARFLRSNILAVKALENEHEPLNSRHVGKRGVWGSRSGRRRSGLLDQEAFHGFHDRQPPTPEELAGSSLPLRAGSLARHEIPLRTCFHGPKALNLGGPCSPRFVRPTPCSASVFTLFA
ncbi:unnamed protein product [Ascophyllum nodosum]